MRILGPALLLLLAALTATAVLSARQGQGNAQPALAAADGGTMSTITVGAPPIDKRQPAKLETATFALG